jgi:hypothetical protein
MKKAFPCNECGKRFRTYKRMNDHRWDTGHGLKRVLEAFTKAAHRIAKAGITVKELNNAFSVRRSESSAGGEGSSPR